MPSCEHTLHCALVKSGASSGVTVRRAKTATSGNWGGTTHLAHRRGAEEIIAVLDEEEAATAENLESEDCPEALQDAIFGPLIFANPKT
jgi:hypothetical protein